MNTEEEHVVWILQYREEEPASAWFLHCQGRDSVGDVGEDVSELMLPLGVRVVWMHDSGSPTHFCFVFDLEAELDDVIEKQATGLLRECLHKEDMTVPGFKEFLVKAYTIGQRTGYFNVMTLADLGKVMPSKNNWN